MNIPILHGTTGLHTESSESSARYKDGVKELAACLNVDISDRGKISRRRAITNQIALSSHSLHPVGSRYCLFVAGSSLNLMLPSFTEYETVATVTPELKVSCFVLDGVAYWSNGVEKGKIVNGVNEAWEKSDTIYSDNVTRQFYDPPPGEHVAFYNGHAYVGSGDVVWYSDGYAPDVFALGDSYLPFESKTTMVRPVGGGIYISNSNETWFLSGGSPETFVWNVVDNVPALPHTAKPSSLTPGEEGWKQEGKETAFWLTNKGLMFGDDVGNISNITEKKIDLPATYTSGGILIDGTTIIAQFI